MKPGSKVRFTTKKVTKDQIQYQYHYTDPRGILKPGQIYEVHSIDEYDYSTIVFLKGIDGDFNSVWFEESKKEL